jgi:hypothetical protein
VAPIEWACAILGSILVWAYAWILDDAFVYFRYLDNALFLGYGLVNNAGEYVEGYSSPAWLLLLGALRAAGLSYWAAVIGVGLVSFLVFAAALVALGRRLAPAGVAVVNLPLCILAVNYAVCSYFTSGTESPLVQLAAVATALFVLSPGSRPLQLVLGVFPLVRHELAVPLLLCAIWSWRRLGRPPWTLVASTAALGGSWLVFRVVTYADLLPNTFYLKDAVDLEQGLLYVWDTVSAYRLDLLLLLAVGALVLVGGRDRAHDATPRPELRLRDRLFMLGLALSVTAYVVKIGGDPRHYRYLAYPVVLSVCALAGVGELLLARFLPARGRVVAALAGVVVLLGSASRHPAQLSTHPLLGDPEHTPVYQISDAALHRGNFYLVPSAKETGSGFDQKDLYAEQRARSVPYDRVAVGAACFKHYVGFNERALNFYGLTDAFLARTDVAYSRPAHKVRLHPLALDLADILESGIPPGRGMHREAIRRGIAPEWIAKNLDTIEAIERKVYNRHDLVENLRLALTPVGRIDPGPRHRGPRPPAAGE